MSDVMVSREALEEAARRLRALEDVCLEEDEAVPPWLIAARRSVTGKLEEVPDA